MDRRKLKNIMILKTTVFGKFLLELTAAFLSVKDGTFREGVQNFFKKGTGKALYELSDWGLSILTGMFVGFMRFIEKPFWEIFLIVWFANILISWFFVYISDKTEIDITLMEGARNSVDVLYRKSKILGILAGLAISVKIIFWNGPDSFIIFIRRSISTRAFKIAIFIATSAFQMSIWVALYTLGYESIWALIKGFMGK
jgi:hypothetical protein